MAANNHKSIVSFLVRSGAATLLLLLASPSLFCQEYKIGMAYPVHSQYLHNGLIINPGYAGSREVLSLFASARKQWVGIDGAPTYESLSFHALSKKGKVGLGLYAQLLQYGFDRNTSVYANYAYHLKLKGDTRLSLGLKGGVDMVYSDYSSLVTIDPGDGAFADDSRSYLLPNVGTGVYLYNKKFFAGVAVPQFLSWVKGSNGEASYNTFQKFDITATAGALVTFSDAFKFKPSFLVEYSLDKSKKTRIDLNGNFIIYDLVWVGASWRTAEKALVGILQLQISPYVMFGYSYDFLLNDLNPYSSGSHEIIFRYEFGYRVSAENPRYF